MTTATLYIGGQCRTAAVGGTFAATNPANREEIAQVSDGGAAVSIGPLIDSEALAKMERQVGDALRKGATLLAGGSRLVESGLDAGHFFAPTVLADVTPAMEIYREETFGPIAP